MLFAGRRILALMAFLVGALGFVALSHGHALQPGYLELRLIDKDLYAVVWKTPAIGGRTQGFRLLSFATTFRAGDPAGNSRRLAGGNFPASEATAGFR